MYVSLVNVSLFDDTFTAFGGKDGEGDGDESTGEGADTAGSFGHNIRVYNDKFKMIVHMFCDVY